MDKVLRKPALRSNSLSGSIGENRANLDVHETGIKVFQSEKGDGEKVNCHSPKLARRNKGAGSNNKRKTSPHLAQIAEVNADSSPRKTKSAEIRGKLTGNERKLTRSSERDETGNSAQVAAVREDIGICEEKRFVIVDELNETATLENRDAEEQLNGEEESIKADDKYEAETSNPLQETADKPDEISLFPKKVTANGNGQRRLQSLVDLVMWENAARSAFVFGMGTFLITSLSCTDALNFSFISVVSYVSLVYLAARFLYRSLISKVEYSDDELYVIGEEEAACVMRSVMPYVNELLFSTKALFSGDPATTMKMSVILFLLARYGSSITILKLLKLGFFGVFTLPKFYSSYSAHLSSHGKFWFRRFRDVWNGCSHKKSVAFTVFALVWNLSSAIARAWALFMIFVAVRYYKLGAAGFDDGALVGTDGATCENLSDH